MHAWENNIKSYPNYNTVHAQAARSERRSKKSRRQKKKAWKEYLSKPLIVAGPRIELGTS